MTIYPLVSIGLPVHNGERYIRSALDSLLGQNYTNVEVIISDNASTDRTLEICKEYAITDSRITIYSQTYNIGIRANFQTVLKKARGKYFMWAAVDDYWLPDFISVLVKELDYHPDAGVAMCGVRRVFEDGSLADTIRFLGREDPTENSFLGVAFGLVSWLKYNLFIYGLFRTDLLKSAGALIPTVSSADRWFLFQFALGTRLRYVDQVLHVRTVHSEQFHERYPEDEYGKMKLVSSHKVFDFDPVCAVWEVLSKSKIVPRRRKMFIPIVLGYLLFRRVMVLGVRRIQRGSRT